MRPAETRSFRYNTISDYTLTNRHCCKKITSFGEYWDSKKLLKNCSIVCYVRPLRCSKCTQNTSHAKYSRQDERYNDILNNIKNPNNVSHKHRLMLSTYMDMISGQALLLLAQFPSLIWQKWHCVNWWIKIVYSHVHLHWVASPTSELLNSTLNIEHHSTPPNDTIPF